MPLRFNFLFLVIVLLLSCEGRTQPQFIYTDCDVDTMPRFNGTEEDLLMFFSKRVHPSHLMTGDKDRASFQVVLKLYFSPLGLLDSSDYMLSSNVYLERAIERALEEMPPWRPAVKDGVKVAAHVFIPLIFRDDGGYFTVLRNQRALTYNKNQGGGLLKTVLVLGTIALFVIFVFNQ